jgi:hypothetical protein
VSGPLRRERAIEVALIVGVMGIAAALVAAGVRVMEEDGFYYLKIAQNVAAGRGSTFDGLHATNGYQPLWLVCLVPIFWLGLSTEGVVAAAALAQAALLAGAAVLLFRVARANGLPPGPAALAGCVWVALIIRTGLSGVEFSLTATLVAAVALQLSRNSGPAASSPRACAVMGLLLGLAILSRLDTSLLALLVAIEWSARARGRPGDAARLAALAAPPLLVGAGYALVNAAVFGNPWPVSGAAKRVWSIYLLATDPVYRAHGWLAAKAWQLTWPLRHPLALAMPSMLACAGVCGLLWSRGPEQLRILLRRLRPLVLFAVLSRWSMRSSTTAITPGRRGTTSRSRCSPRCWPARSRTRCCRPCRCACPWRCRPAPASCSSPASPPVGRRARPRPRSRCTWPLGGPATTWNRKHASAPGTPAPSASCPAARS